MSGPELWCQVALVDPDGFVIEGRAISGRGHPDLQAVEEVARLAWRVSRLGGRARLSEVSKEMAELLELSGLRLEVER